MDLEVFIECVRVLTKQAEDEVEVKVLLLGIEKQCFSCSALKARYSASNFMKILPIRHNFIVISI